MISEGSCDTEDWSSDAENLSLHHRKKYILKYIKIKNNIMSQYYIMRLLYFWSSKYSIDEQNLFFEKHLSFKN